MMNRIYLTILCLGLLCFFSCNEEGAEPNDGFRISGKVTDNLGFPLEGVVVNTIVDTTVTDASGFFSVLAYPAGAIEFNKTGYEKLIEPVNSRQTIDASLFKIPDNGETQYSVKDVELQCDNGTTIFVKHVEVRDFGKGTGTATWTRDKVWVLKNKVFVNEGQTLTIQPGTIIKGGTGQGESASLLAVARGGKIMASGNANLPIIFTSESDVIVRDSFGNLCKQTNLTKNDKGLWGGLVVLGKSILNTDLKEGRIEGIPESEPRGIFGGNVDNDNSGVLRYLSIRHAGTNITVDKEVNAMLLGGVGSGTTIEYIETFACDDDGFEVYGGSVNTKYLVSAFNGDDAIDFNLGWRGLNQFWLIYLDTDADRASEMDGGNDPITGVPFSTPVVYNATFVGPGSTSGKRGWSFRKNAGGYFYNCIVERFTFGIDIEYTGNNLQDCYTNFKNGILEFQHNLFYDIGNSTPVSAENQSPLPNNDPEVVFVVETLNNYFNDLANGNAYVDPGLDGKFIPIAGSPAAQIGADFNNPFFTVANYKGCFEPGAPRWLDGWTRFSQE